LPHPRAATSDIAHLLTQPRQEILERRKRPPCPDVLPRDAIALGLKIAEAVLHSGDVTVIDRQVQGTRDLCLELLELGLELSRLARCHALAELIERHLKGARSDLFVDFIERTIDAGAVDQWVRRRERS
jgi:hypothetical protein